MDLGAAGQRGPPEQFEDFAGQKVLGLLPHFGGMEPVDRIVAARAVTVGTFCQDVAWIVGVEAGLLLVVTAWLLSRRELAGGPET